MNEEEIKKQAIGTVDAVKGEATEDEIAAAIAEIETERAISDEDRRGE